MTSLTGNLKAWILYRQFKHGKWDSGLVSKANAGLATARSPASRYKLLEMLLATVPPEQLPANLLDNWASQLPDSRLNRPSAKLAALVATVYILLDKESDALSLISKIVDTQADVLRFYPACLALLGKIPEKNEQHQSLETSQLQALKLQRSEKGLNEFLQTNAIQSVSVVGNAPTVLDKQHGSLIDSADCVVRFNNVAISDTLKASIGSKTTVWMTNPSLDFEFNAQELPASNLWVSSYLPYARPSRFWPRFAELPAQTLLQAEHKVWLELVERLQAPPSAGLLSLSALAKTSCDIHAFGFTRRSSSPDSNSTNHWTDRKKKSTRHNWDAEQLVLDELAESRVSFHG